MDISAERLLFVNASVGLTLNRMTHCAYYSNVDYNGEPVHVTCSRPLIGSYVKLMMGLDIIGGEDLAVEVYAISAGTYD